MKKVLYIHHAAGLGGAPISLREMIYSLDRSRYDAEVLLLKDSIVREVLEKDGIKVSVAQSSFYKKYYQFFPHLEPHYFRWWEIRKIFQFSILWLLSRFIFAPQLLKGYQFDILHLNSSVLTDFLKAGRLRGRTVIHIREPVAQGYLGIRLNVMRREIESFADKIIAISHDNAQRLGFEKKTTVIYNFTDLAQKPTELPEAKVALYVGGDSEIKGFLTIVEALEHLDSDITVWFCGYYQSDHKKQNSDIFSRLRALKPSNKRIEKALATIRSHPRAKVLGLRLDIPDLLRQSRVLISPFTVEHFSRPVIEAFANGRAVIATDVDGMSEVVEHGVNGLIVPKNNPFELALAINRICSNPFQAEKFALAGYETAREKFTKRNIELVQSIYSQMS